MTKAQANDHVRPEGRAARQKKQNDGSQFCVSKRKSLQRRALAARAFHPANGCGARGANMYAFMLSDFVWQHVPNMGCLKQTALVFNSMPDKACRHACKRDITLFTPSKCMAMVWSLYSGHLVNTYGHMAKQSGAILYRLSLSLFGTGGSTSASWRTWLPLATGACSACCGRSAHLPSCCCG